MKGKLKQVDDQLIGQEEEEQGDGKGKEKQVEREGVQGQLGDDATPAPSMGTHSEVIVPPRPTPPLLDRTSSQGTSRPAYSELGRAAASLPPSQHDASPVSNPFDLSADERTRARAQIAHALGVGAAPQLVAGRPLSDQARPSMLSALLTDILGLRGAQTGVGEATPGSQSHGTSLGSGRGEAPGTRENPRSRASNGGTSVIVQGALISRTLPSRQSATGAANQGNSAALASPRRASSHPPMTLGSGTLPAEETARPATTDGEAQMATIEEQAAMLIRLLSIATAATAASLVSAPSQQDQNRGQGRESGVGVQRSPSSSATSAGSTHGAHTATQVSASTAFAPSVLSASTSASSSWRNAAQTYQSLRDRFFAFRSRLRGQGQRGAHTEPEQQQTSSGRVTASTGDEQQQQQPAHQAPVDSSRGEEQTSDAARRGTQEEESGSLSALSSMLQDAIREGIQGTENRTAREPPGRGGTTTDELGNRAESVNATLDAVRGGQLSRGEEGSFDRFLYDLMADLDVAVRGLPRENVPNEVGSADDSTRLRRQRDLHDGQLSFFRLFTFPAATPQPESISSPSSLLPCVVVGVRSLEPSSQSMQGERHGAARSSAEAPTSAQDTVMTDEPAATAEGQRQQQPQYGGQGAPMSRFLLFVSGGHYPPQHPLFHSSTDEASRDLMVLMEFLGAMASMHATPNTTVTKDQIAKSRLRKVMGGLAEIAALVKDNKVMENTSERCLICLEDWKVCALLSRHSRTLTQSPPSPPQEHDEDRRLLECAHLFHAPCIDQWLTASNNSCPLCRRQAVQLPGAPSPAIVPSLP